MVARDPVFIWWVTCFLWSGGWLFIKLGLRDLPPLTFAALRLVLAAIILVPIVVARHEWKRLPAHDLATIAASGLLLLGVNYALVFWGAQFVPSGLTALLQATTPVLGFALGILLGAERFTWVRAGAIALGLVGVAIVSRGERSAGEWSAIGSLAIVLGAFCAAAAYAIVKRRGTHLPPALLVTGQTLCALLPLLVAALLLEGNPAALAWTPGALIALLYLGIASSVVAFWLNYWLLRRMEATTVLSTALVQPLIAALLGAAFLGEQLGVHAIIGGACILLSAAVILRR